MTDKNSTNPKNNNYNNYNNYYDNPYDVRNIRTKDNDEESLPQEMTKSEVSLALQKASTVNPNKNLGATGSDGLKGSARELGGKIFKNLRNKKIDVSDLQKAWKNKGYPTDTNDIANILKSQGFGTAQINKIFKEVFKEDPEMNDEQGESANNPVIKKIADYVKKNGYQDQIKEFMAQEYGFKEAYEMRGNLVIEDIRKIFTEIAKEDRENRFKLIKEYEEQYLGRSKK